MGASVGSPSQHDLTRRTRQLASAPLASADLTDGYPRWRVALGCLTQLVWFPAMFLVFALGQQVRLGHDFALQPQVRKVAASIS